MKQKISALTAKTIDLHQSTKQDFFFVMSNVAYDQAKAEASTPEEMMMFTLANLYAQRASFAIRPGDGVPSTADFALQVIQLMQKHRAIPFEVGFTLATLDIFNQEELNFASWPLDPPLALPNSEFQAQMRLK